MAGETDRLAEISAALDGEAPMPADLTHAEAEFIETATRVRAAFRFEPSVTPPDVTDAVLRDVSHQHTRRWRRPTLVAAAAVFVVAAVIGALAVRPGGPASPDAVFAQVGERLIEAQTTVMSLDANVSVVERGVHPDVPERRLAGTLRYRAPERLWLSLRQTSPAPAGWPRNDLELVIDEETGWQRGLDDCPVGAQPGCLAPSERVVTDLAPFASEWIPPLDLVVPVGAFLPITATVATEVDDRVLIDTTAARVDQLIEGLRSAGAIRAVHPTDDVRLEMDRATLTLRRLTVTAADNAARANWAATNGYQDRAGTEILAVSLSTTSLPDAPFPAAPDASAVSAGFTPTQLEGIGTPPPGYTLHRVGELHDSGPLTSVFGYSDGRAWIRIDVTSEWDQPHLFGSLGPLVRPVPVGDGTGYTDPDGTRLAVHTPDLDIVVTGSVELGVLASTAAGIVTGVPIPAHWDQAQQATEIPAGALVPQGDHLAVLSDGELLIAVGGPGRTGYQLSQRPAKVLPPPPKADVIEAEVRGHPARYAPRLGTLTWLEAGWMRELRAEAVDLDKLRAIADALVEP